MGCPPPPVSTFPRLPLPRRRPPLSHSLPPCSLWSVCLLCIHGGIAEAAELRETLIIDF
jgi:hypothetical protein